LEDEPEEPLVTTPKSNRSKREESCDVSIKKIRQEAKTPKRNVNADPSFAAKNLFKADPSKSDNKFLRKRKKRPAPRLGFERSNTGVVEDEKHFKLFDENENENKNLDESESFFANRLNKELFRNEKSTNFSPFRSLSQPLPIPDAIPSAVPHRMYRSFESKNVYKNVSNTTLDPPSFEVQKHNTLKSYGQNNVSNLSRNVLFSNLDLATPKTTKKKDHSLFDLGLDPPPPFNVTAESGINVSSNISSNISSSTLKTNKYFLDKEFEGLSLEQRWGEILNTPKNQKIKERKQKKPKEKKPREFLLDPSDLEEQADKKFWERQKRRRTEISKLWTSVNKSFEHWERVLEKSKNRDKALMREGEKWQKYNDQLLLNNVQKKPEADLMDESVFDPQTQFVMPSPPARGQLHLF